MSFYFFIIFKQVKLQYQNLIYRDNPSSNNLSICFSVTDYDK